MKKFRRAAAMAGIILLLGMYGATMFFALSDSPNAKAMLMASIYCTIAVPVLLYAILLTAKVLEGKGREAMPPDQGPEELPDDAGNEASEEDLPFEADPAEDLPEEKR